MEFFERTFVDEDIILDGNTFSSCVFDGCVLRYNGGPMAIIGGLDIRNGGHIVLAEHLDPLNNPLSSFIVAGIEAQGGTRLTDDEIAAQQPAPPKKDIG